MLGVFFQHMNINYNLVTVYRSPNNSAEDEKLLIAALNDMSYKNDNLCITGDFN